MEKTQKIQRSKFLALLNAVIALADRGNLEFEDWLNVNETRIWLEATMKNETKIFEKLKESTGYAKYVERVSDLHLKGVKNIKHTDEEIESIKKFDKDKIKFEESEVEIKFHPISKDLLKKLPEELLGLRNALLPIVDLEKKEKAK